MPTRLVPVILAHLHRRFPYHQNATWFEEGEVRPPWVQTPVFAGSYDWHSSVHSHWALVRLRLGADDAARARIDAALDQSITDEGVAAERAHLARRPGFEVPYGMAWLLTLCGELRAAGDARAARLAPLEQLARDRLLGWLARVPAPVRTGEHGQSAFAAGLALDWARARDDREAIAAITTAAERHHGDDRDLPLHLEPGGHDFVSPTLGAAALIARVRPPDDFASWLDGAAPSLGRVPTLTPVIAADRADGKLVHWDGLNLSRAWMLGEITAALPADDTRVTPLTALAAAHGDAGVAALDDMAYAGTHWLPSFAVYWLTGRLSV